MASLPTPGVTTNWGDDLNAVIRSMLGGDEAPASANAKDDEFEDSAVGPGWSTTPTAPSVMDVDTTYAGALYVKTQANNAAYQGKIQAVPGAYPFTITTKVSDFALPGSSRAGLFISAGNTASSNASMWGWVNNTGGLQHVQQQLGGTWNSNGTTRSSAASPLHLRMVVRSASAVDCQLSAAGRLWTTVTTINPGYTPTHMGIFASSESAGAGVQAEAIFDFFRVT